MKGVPPPSMDLTLKINNNNLDNSNTNLVRHNNSNKANLKVAICYFGTTRTVKKTYKSHFDKIFHVLRDSSIDYKVYMHTWSTDRLVTLTPISVLY